MCSETTTNKLVVVKENKCKFTLDNKDEKTIKKIKVDGCLIHDKEDKRPRCDYVFEIDDPCQKAIYVELKGKDIEKAYDQLVSTLSFPELQPEHQLLIKECYIIASRVPQSGPKIQELQLELRKKHKSSLVVKTLECTVKV